MKQKQEKAIELFREGYNCAQSVLAVFAEDLGMEQEKALQFSNGFGGGMGGMQKTCGAVSGAVMVIGSYYYSRESFEKAGMKDAVQTFFHRFTKKHGAIDCLALTGFDFNDPFQKQQALDENLYEEKCQLYIRSSIEILQAILSLE